MGLGRPLSGGAVYEAAIGLQERVGHCSDAVGLFREVGCEFFFGHGVLHGITTERPTAGLEPATSWGFFPRATKPGALTRLSYAGALGREMVASAGLDTS